MYQLPITLKDDIKRLGALAADYREKKIDPVQFRAHRVPMGVYEQRQNETYMSRVRTTGGVIHPDQFLQLIKIARQHHSNLLHITTRQEIQVHNQELNDVEPIMYGLQEAGLATKGGGGNTIRNILISEESGIGKNELFDATPYAMELTTRLIAEADSYLLPRKMKIAFSSDKTQIGYAAINDVGFVAKIKNGEKGFQVYAGGGGGSNSTVGWVLFDFVPAGEVYAVAEVVKKFFSEHGNRKNKHKARLRYIFFKLGAEETLRLIKEYYDSAIKSDIPFVVNETEDERPSYVFQPLEEAAAVDPEEYDLWKTRYVNPQKQNGYNSILVPFLFGNIWLTDEKTVSGMEKLLEFIARFGKHTIRFTTTQNIRLRNIPDEALPSLYALLKTFVQDLDNPLLVNNITSCTGADTCRLGICLSKGLAAAIRRRLQKSNLPLDIFDKVRIHISGCPNSCGMQLWGDIGFSGKVMRNDRTYPGYLAYLGANREDAPKFAEFVGEINAHDIPDYVHRLLESYIEVQQEYPVFSSYLEAKGKALALQLIGEYKNVPDFSDDKNYYFDWGSDSIFNVLGRGKPECSAGLFDMIEVDITLINENKEALKTETDKTQKNSHLYNIIHSASRMLLVTRGLDPKTPQEVFEMFIKSFIECGLVDQRFKNIVSIAGENKESDFIPYENEIYELSDSVIELYKNMDDSLQFKNVNQKPQEKENAEKVSVSEEGKNTASKNQKFKDLRGVACPMNFVQTKIQLAAMQSGEELEVWLDDGQPIDNVPASVRNEGHEILEQVRQDVWWKVIIKKK